MNWKSEFVSGSRAFKALAVIVVLLGMGCGSPREEGPSLGGDGAQDPLVAMASLERFPLGFLVQHRGRQLTDVSRNTDLYPRLSALLGSSLPRILSNGQNLAVLGSHLVALPHPKAESWCNAAVFWADLPNDRLHVRLPIGGVVRSFDEGPPESPPAEVVAAIEAFDGRLPNGCGDAEFLPDTPPAPAGCSSTFGLSPDKVYVLGTLSPGLAGRNALFDPAEPHRYMVGFPASTLGKLKPDGSLVYSDSDGKSLRLFVPDTHERDPRVASRDRQAGGAGCVYPEVPEANDIVLSTPGCQEPLYPGRFWIRAGDGAVIYDCSQGEPKYFVVGGGSLALDADQPLAFGGRQTALFPDGFALSIADTTGTAPTIRVEIPDGLRPKGPVRSTADGYLIALVDGSDKPPPSLWRISFSGQISRVADYSPPPAELRFGSGSWTSARLAADGTLWVTSYGGNVNAVVAMRPGGESQVVFREQTFPEPVVFLHSSTLVAAR